MRARRKSVARLQRERLNSAAQASPVTPRVSAAKRKAPPTSATAFGKYLRQRR